MARRRGRQSVAEQVYETLKFCTVDVNRIPAEVIEAGIASIESRRPGQFAPADIMIAGRSLLRIMTRPQALRRRFRTVAIPVLLLHGDQDRLVSIRVARAAAREFPEWRFEVAENIGHVPMLEAPDWTAAKVLDWMTKDAKLLEV
jgi:pimeloyl-ACP methyl ester carboxylesterase